MRGHLSEGARWLEEALATSFTAASRARAEVLNGLGSISRTVSDFGRAQTCHEEALALYREIGDPEGIADSLTQLGLLALFQHDLERFTIMLEESLAVARRSGYQEIISGVMMGLAWVVCDEGDIDRAQQMWGEALEMERERGNLIGVSLVLNFMGYAELDRRNHQRATVLLEESLVLSRRLEHKYITATCLSHLGIAAVLRGEARYAQTLIKQSLIIHQELGTGANSAEALEYLAEAAGALREHVRAARLWGTAKALRDTLGSPWSPTERRLHEPQIIAARSRLDEASWEAAFAEGKTMTFEEAVEYALDEEGLDPPASPVPRVPPTEEHLSSLTRREREVATLVARGLTNRQVATDLSISERTAANHVAKILKKLGLRSRVQIASWAAQRHSIAPD